MNIGTHLRNKMFAGVVAAIPLAVVAIVLYYLEKYTQPLTDFVGLPPIPGLGAVLGLVGIYLLGVLVTSLVGRYFAGWADWFLRRVPGLNHLYVAWKDVLVQKPGQITTFHKVVLIPSRDGMGKQIGFTSGEIIPGDIPQMCVFVPQLPNPLAGQLILFPATLCHPVAVTPEDAFKYLLSTGNFMPPALRGVV